MSVISPLCKCIRTRLEYVGLKFTGKRIHELLLYMMASKAEPVIFAKV